MLRELKALGKYMREDEGVGGLDIFMDIQKLEGFDNIITIDFSQETESYVFSGVTVHDMPGRESKLLYKFGSSRGGDRTPTSCVTEVEKTVPRIFDWFSKEESDSELIAAATAAYEEQGENIQTAVEEKYNSVDGGAVLTVRFEKDGELRFIGAFDIFQDALKRNEITNWYHKYDTDSVSEDATCAVCGQQKQVFGYAFPLNFYTVNNPRLAPDFEQGRSWQNIPICEDCGIDLTIGEKFLEDRAKFSYYIGENVQYYVIPSFPIGEPVTEILQNTAANSDEPFLECEGFYRERGQNEFPLTMTFLFYQDEQSSKKVQKYVEDVAPSHLLEADEALQDAYLDIYEGRKLDVGIEENQSIRQLNTLIFRVLPQPDRDDSGQTDKKAFFNDALFLTEKILKAEPVKFEYLLDLFVPEIMSQFRNNEYYPVYAVRTFMFLEFLNAIDIVEGYGDTMTQDFEQLMADLETIENETLNEFFENYGHAFDTAEKRAIFLEGVLAQHLMDKQQAMRNSDDAPFRKKLSSLRLNERKLKELFPRIDDDLETYNEAGERKFRSDYTALKQTIGHYLIEADEQGWELEDTELRYYFMLGLSLNKAFKDRSNNGGN